MNLVQVDILKSLPYAPNPSGRYFYTTVVYADRDNYVSYTTMANNMYSRESLITRENVWFHGFRFHDPPGRGNIAFTVSYSSPGEGSQPPVDNFSLITIARWTLVSVTGRKTYRLSRAPLDITQIDGEYLTPAAVLHEQTMLNTFCGPDVFYNKYGELLSHGIVSPRVHMWQLRHGTKRERSRFWLP